MTYSPTNQQQKQFLCKDPLSFLDEENFRKYHVELAHTLKSIHAAIFLAELANRRKYHRMYGHEFLEFEEKSWFYYSHETGHERLAMSRKEQDTAIKILLEFGLIAQVNKTVPQKRFFYIYEDVVLSLFGLSKIVSKMTETDKLDCSKKDYRMTETDKLERPKWANCTYIERELQEQQQPPTPKGEQRGAGAPVVVAFYECLREVAISDEEKRSLTAQYSEAIVAKAVKVATHPSTVIKKTLMGLLVHCCKNHATITIPEDSPPSAIDPKKLSEINKKKALQIIKDYQSKANKMGFNIFEDGHQLLIKFTPIAYDDPRFNEMVERYLKEAKLK